MKKIVLVVFVVLILVLSNYFSGYIRLFTGEGIGKRYTYQNADATFAYDYIPTKGGEIELMEASFDSFNLREGKQDTTLYRTFSKKPLQFWNWHRYLTHPMYDYPLLETNE